MKKILTTLFLTFGLLLCFNVTAKADAGIPFSMTATINEKGYGFASTTLYNARLTRGRAGLSIWSVSGGTWQIDLFKETFASTPNGTYSGVYIDSCYNITKSDWRRFYGISDTIIPTLAGTVRGTPGKKVTITGRLHDHGDC